MAQKKNQNKQSGQLARQSQKQTSDRNSAPIARAIGQVSSAPKVFNGKRMIKVTHRELVATISGNTTFGVNQYYLNPGLSATFPWLSTIANSFEQYRFSKLCFHYVTRAPTSYKGSILMAPDYDPLDSSPSTEVAASQMDGAVEDSPWKEQYLNLNIQDMFPMGPRKYIRSSTVASSDLKTYDAGQVFVCSVACDDTNAIGKLWVEYDVELHIPQNPAGTSQGNIGNGAFFRLAGGNQGLATGSPEGIAFDSEEINDLGITRSTAVYTVPAGSYVVNAIVTANGGTSQGATLELTVQVGGVTVSPNVGVTYAAFSGTNLPDYLVVPVSFTLIQSAEFNFNINVEYTSAAGTLVLVDQMCTLQIIKIA